MINNYQERCNELKTFPRRILLSFAPVSSQKNIEFLKSILNIPNQFLWPIFQIEILNLKNNPSKKIKFKDDKDENFFLIKQRDLFQLSEKNVSN